MASALPPFCFGWESLGALTPQHPKECRMNAEIGAKIEAGGRGRRHAGRSSPRRIALRRIRGRSRPGRVACWRRGGFPAPENLCIARLPRRPSRPIADQGRTDRGGVARCDGERRLAGAMRQRSSGRPRDDGQRLIKTVPRRGYLFDATPVDTAHADACRRGPAKTLRRCDRLRAGESLLPLLALAAAIAFAGVLWFALAHRGQTGAVVGKNTITILPLTGDRRPECGRPRRGRHRGSDHRSVAPARHARDRASGRKCGGGWREEHRRPVGYLCPERQPAAAGRSGFDRGEIADDGHRRAAMVGAVRLWRAGRMELASRHHGAHRQ